MPQTARYKGYWPRSSYTFIGDLVRLQHFRCPLSARDFSRFSMELRRISLTRCGQIYEKPTFRPSETASLNTCVFAIPISEPITSTFLFALYLEVAAIARWNAIDESAQFQRGSVWALAGAHWVPDGPTTLKAPTFGLAELYSPAITKRRTPR